MLGRLGKRIVDWSEEHAPPIHRFLTSSGPWASFARSFVSIALVAIIGGGLLWGLTGQPLGEPPVVVVESGSMMHCANGVGHLGDACESASFGRIGTIEPGDLVFVRNVDGPDDVATMAEDGKKHHGKPGDVIVFQRPGLPPVIHRAMFWVDIHGDGTFSIPALGIDHERSTNIPALTDSGKWGLRGNCVLDLPHRSGGPELSGFVTKGDNNSCWDQGSNGSAIVDGPVRPEDVLGKARGEVPWIGLLKLLVFDLFGPTTNYAVAPGDVKWMMWISLAILIGGPYAYEKWAHQRDEKKAEQERLTRDD